MKSLRAGKSLTSSDNVVLVGSCLEVVFVELCETGVSGAGERVRVVDVFCIVLEVLGHQFVHGDHPR